MIHKSCWIILIALLYYFVYIYPVRFTVTLMMLKHYSQYHDLQRLKRGSHLVPILTNKRFFRYADVCMILFVVSWLFGKDRPSTCWQLNTLLFGSYAWVIFTFADLIGEKNKYLWNSGSLLEVYFQPWRPWPVPCKQSDHNWRLKKRNAQSIGDSLW